MPFDNRLSGVSLITNEYLTPIETDPIVLPHRWVGRPYQQNLYDTFSAMLHGENDYQEYLLDWHRRSGKDTTFFQLVVLSALYFVGDYGYSLPLNKQAKGVILNGTVRDSYGTPCKFTDFIPPSQLLSVNYSEGIIKLVNGSNIYVMGSDSYDSHVGLNLAGMVFSEWSLTDPKAYDYFQPMLEESRRQEKGRGWCLKCWTPRGKNHAWDDKQNALKDCNKDTHYVSSMSILDTTDNDNQSLYTMDDYNRWVAQGKDENILKQEWLLSYDSAIAGLIYGKQLQRAREEGRVKDIPIDPKIPVITFWDIGVNDETSIWFMQPSNIKDDDTLRVIHYYECRDEGIDFYIQVLKDFATANNIRYGTVYLPHDGKNKEWIAGQRRNEVMASKGFNVHVVPRIQTVQLGIDQTKNLFKRLHFNLSGCEKGLKCLDNYVYKVVNNITTTPLHNWASNGADALRMAGQFYADKYVDATHNREAWDDIQDSYNNDLEDEGYVEYDDWE